MKIKKQLSATLLTSSLIVNTSVFAKQPFAKDWKDMRAERTERVEIDVYDDTGIPRTSATSQNDVNNLNSHFVENSLDKVQVPDVGTLPIESITVPEGPKPASSEAPVIVTPTTPTAPVIVSTRTNETVVDKELKDIAPDLTNSLINPDGSIKAKGFSSNKLSDDDYDNKVFHLASLMWGVSEVGEKYCKPAGEAHTKAIADWFKASKDYITSEKTRDALLKARTEMIQKQALAIAESKSIEIQAEAIRLQIESVNAYIDSISGIGFFNLDDQKDKARASARMPSREKLVLAAMESIVENDKTHLKNVETYNKLVDSIRQSRDVASVACARTKIIEECQTDSDNNETCTKKEVPHPVPGSCEMKEKYLTIYENGPVKDYATLYLLKAVPSAELNKRMGRLEELMGQMISFMPVSNEKKYDWTTMLVSTQKEMKDTRKKFGILCPSTAKETDYDKKFVDQIAPPSNDPIIEMGKYALGVNLNNIEYDQANRYYENIKKEKNLSDVDGVKATWDMMINSSRGEHYAKNKTALTPDKYSENDRASLSNWAKENKLVQTQCTSSNCNSFKGPRRSDNQPQVFGSENLSTDAKNFLATFGMNGQLAELAKDTFVENWNQSDLIVGQPVNRSNYFRFASDLTTQLMMQDSQKLNALYTQRNKLIEYLTKIEKAMLIKNQPGQSIPSANFGRASIAGLKTYGYAPYAVKDINDNTAVKKLTVTSGASNQNVAAGIPFNNTGLQLAGLGTSGDYLGADYSAGSLENVFSDAGKNAINKLMSQSKQTKNALTKFNGKKATLANSLHQDASAKSFASKMGSSLSKFKNNGNFKEAARALALGQLNKAPATSEAKPSQSSSRVVGTNDKSSNSGSYDSYGSSGGATSSSTASLANNTIVERAPASNPVPTEGKFELFNAISDTYKKVSKDRLNLEDE